MVPALTVEMLSALKNVKIITEYVDIQAVERSPESLDFLGNLAVIEGRKLRYVVLFRYIEFLSRISRNVQIWLTSISLLYLLAGR